MSNIKIGAVIVAGGLSSRMNDFKPLLSIGNKTMIETVIENYRVIGVEEIVVVTGYRAGDIEEVLKESGISFVRNENYEKTHMFDSVCMGLKELSDKIDFTFVSPVDSPFVQQFTLKRMIDEMQRFNYRLIQPAYEGKNGHPLLLRKDFFSIMLEHDGSMGMQGAIARMGVGYGKISFVDPGIVLDSDRSNDYIRLLEYNENRDCPSIELCRKIQDYFNMTDAVKLHSDMVADVAINIIRNLSRKGILLNSNVIMAASLLHDIAKGRPRHAEVGAEWLMEMGYEEISKITAEHMELREIHSVPTEKEVVFLADKLVKEDRLVTIDERFLLKENLYKNDACVAKIIGKRKKQAEILHSIIFENKNAKYEV